MPSVTPPHTRTYIPSHSRPPRTMVSRIQQSLSFHSSPESFIFSRLQQLSTSNPSSWPGSSTPPSIVRAAILNRNVHIISSYLLCEAVLNGDTSDSSAVSKAADTDDDQLIFAAEPAYKQFMAAFFPGPNILLQDGPRHGTNKARWKERMQDLVSESSGLDDMTRTLTLERFIKPLLASGQASSSGKTTIDLYDSMKALAWDLLFGIFLGLGRLDEDSQFHRIEELQEDLLRGQFSLFPVPFRTPFWSSPRTRGLDAVKSLQEILAARLGDSKGRKSCPFMKRPQGGDADAQSFSEADMVAHLLVFTSSIANKALASLLTAYLINLFLWRDQRGGDVTSLAHLIRSQESDATKTRMFESILAETARLSPPVVGVMRRVRQDIVLRPGLQSRDGEGQREEHAVPNGHDTWLYLAGANRDSAVFEDADLFSWDRYMSPDEGELAGGFAFGGGDKTCLGRDFARQICLTVAETVLDSQLCLEGTITDRGVRHWLGWEKNVPLETIARDLKQLPCQRPRRPIAIDVSVSQ
jgi:cytochrome P450